MGLCHLSEGQAKDLLKRMQGSELLRLEGAGRGAFYRMGARAKTDEEHPIVVTIKHMDWHQESVEKLFSAQI